MQIHLFGATEVVTDSRRVSARDFVGVKPRQILEILALRPGRPVAKEKLADMLWEGEPPASYVTTLEGYVSLMRRAIEPGVPARQSVVITSGGCYTLDAGRVEVDVVRVLDLAARLEVGAKVPWGDIESAPELQRGLPLESERYASWAQEAGAMVQMAAGTVLAAAARGAVAAGQFERAGTLACRAIEFDFFAEAAWRIRLDCLAQQGRCTEALRAYESLKARLADELGVAPDAETRALAERIRRSTGPSPAPSGAAAADAHGGDPDADLAFELVRRTVATLGVDPDRIGAGRLERAVRGVTRDLARLRAGVGHSAPALVRTDD